MRSSLFLNQIRRISTLRSANLNSNSNSLSDCAILKSIRNSNSNSFYHQSAADHVYDNDPPDSQLGDASTYNIERWMSKFKLLMQNENEKELVSKQKKDNRDFEQISTVASKMGLYSRRYERSVVFSKDPLPNYREDLDDKRPQRVVDLDFVVQERVEYHLKAYFYEKLGNTMCNNQVVNQVGTNTRERLPDWQADYTSLTERLIQKKNLELRKGQQDWQQCSEGQKMIEFRKSLPAYKERETLLAAVSQNQVVIVSGETGCGKTTQLPQYILESEVEADRGATCNIICTQPRRISAMTVSERVAAERGENLGETVGYKVRLEAMRGKDTRLLFCTTGTLLRRLLSDRNFEGVTHIIVDEIHERGMNEDFLLIVLKDLLPRKPNLRVVLMSATLNADLFSSYFGDVPMIHIPGSTFPVQTYFLEHILELTGYKLTPSNQIDNYGANKKWKMQKQALRKRKTQITTFVEDPLRGANFSEFNRETQDSLFCWNADSVGFNLIEHVLCHICKSENPGAVLVFMTGWEDINSLKDQLKANSILGDPSRVLLLTCHGSMSSQEQKLIFNKPKDGIRKIVLATNVAETSITINDVVFVVDCGKAKETSYDALNDIPCLLPSWISKAAAKQRRGRAGRVQAGVCYHLYPRVVHDDALSEYQLPELLRAPLHSLCLQIKILQLGSISEFLNKSLQPPDPLSVKNAIEYLKAIGAFDENENLTTLGHKLSMLPVEPKLGKMLVYGAIFNCLDPILTIVAGLSFKDPFALQFDQKDAAESAKVKFSAHDFSDHLAIVRAYDGWIEAEMTQSSHAYCRNNFLSSQSLGVIDSLRRQLMSVLMDIGVVDVGTCNMWSQDYDLICSIICAGLFPDICSVVNNHKSTSFKTMEDGPVLLELSSVNSKPHEIPQPWLVYNGKVKVSSVCIRDTTAVSDSMVLLFGGSISAARLEEKYGHLTMLGGYFEFFTRRSLADTYLLLKRELDEFIQMKLLNPNMGLENYSELLSAVRFLVREDQSKNKSVFDYQPTKDFETGGLLADGGDDNNSKTELQNLLASAGHPPPTYTTVQSRNDNFIALVRFNGFNFTGPPCSNEKEAEKSAACKALVWLTGKGQSWEKTSGRRTFLGSAKIDAGPRLIVGLWDGIEEEEKPTSQIISGLLSAIEDTQSPQAGLWGGS